MPRAVRIHAYGAPEVLKVDNVTIGAPGPGEARIRQAAAGVNFIDIYQRTGLYPLATFPSTLGMEGAGVVTEVGAGVTDIAAGDRVAYAGCPGGYADERIAPADRLVKIPDAISFETAAAIMLRGMTVRFLMRETYRVGPDTVLLFHAAAGGVGLIACQWAKALGATMIGTVSSDEKAAIARSLGCTHVINTSRENFVARVGEITGGEGCDVVYDSIGKDTFPASLACLKPKGLWVSFGNASGPVPPFALTELKGSLFATRPSLFAYTAARPHLLENAHDLFGMVESGRIKIEAPRIYGLADAARAHEDLAARRTTGSIVLKI